MLQLLATVAIAIVLVMWAMRRDRRRLDASRVTAPLQRGRRLGKNRSQAHKEAPPTKFVARWRVQYVDAAGNMTKRIVRVRRVYPSLQQLECWCELREAGRTFNFDGLRQIVDADTGEIVDLAVWLQAREKSRGKRAKRTTSGEAPPSPRGLR